MWKTCQPGSGDPDKQNSLVPKLSFTQISNPSLIEPGPFPIEFVLAALMYEAVK